ncbi:MAG: tol-pal system YbgF family protein [Desulfovibrio sp.]
MHIHKIFRTMLLLVIILSCPIQAVVAQQTASGVAPDFEEQPLADPAANAPQQPATQNATQDPPADVAPAPAEPEQTRNINNQTYEDWLERYRAWDKLDTVYAEQRESPDATLRRIQNLLEAGQPDKAYQLVEQTPPFTESNSTESTRLWYGGRALRALGSPNQAVMWFSESAKLLPTQDLRARFNNEYGLDVVWSDVFRNLFWTYVTTYSLNREAQESFLQLVIDQALLVWPQSPFWNKASAVFSATQAKRSPSPEDTEAASRETYFVNKADRQQIVRALAACGLQSPTAKAPLENIPNEAVRQFWNDVLEALSGQEPEDHNSLFEEQRYVKAASFLGSQPFKHLMKNREHWIYSPEDKRLKVFVGNMLALSPERAQAIFESGEEGKLMPDAEPLDGVETFRFALAVMSGQTKSARKAWDALQPAYLPLSLRLAGMILFNLDVREVTGVADTDTQSNRLLASLASAAGNSPTFAYEAPFWVRVESGKINTTMLNTWPLDKELVFAGWREQWLAAPSAELARRIAFLFPDQQFGMKCALYLAGKAVSDKQLGLASYYLGAVAPEDANATLQAKRLEIKAELEIARDLMPEAYATYQELLASGAPVSDVTRLKIAFLMQQMGNLEGGQDNLRKLWDKRETFGTAMQAEILFYLGEGEAALGNQDQALDSYLQLAWQYPQESMWALTAMYRAANIYEQRDQYEPAVRLLQTVIKNAETPKQREAATSRLESIKGKMGKPSDAGPGALPYPF